MRGSIDRDARNFIRATHWYGTDAEDANASFVDRLDDPSTIGYFFPENEAGPDAATVTKDGWLILVQCKFTEPLSPDKKVSRPTAFSTLSSIGRS
jgi:hypothetical protein